MTITTGESKDHGLAAARDGGTTVTLCAWCDAPMRDIGQGGPSLTEKAPEWLRLLHCTRCDHEQVVVAVAGRETT